MKGRACLPFPFWLLFCFHKTESVCCRKIPEGSKGQDLWRERLRAWGGAEQNRGACWDRKAQRSGIKNLHLNQMWNMSTFHIHCFYILFLLFPIFLHPHHPTPINRGLKSVMRPEVYEFQGTTQQNAWLLSHPSCTEMLFTLCLTLSSHSTHTLMPRAWKWSNLWDYFSWLTCVFLMFAEI